MTGIWDFGCSSLYRAAYLHESKPKPIKQTINQTPNPKPDDKGTVLATLNPQTLKP